MIKRTYTIILMPELPEVETTRLGILPYLTNQTISYITVRCQKLRYPITDQLIKLTNQTILSVQRRAKYLILTLDQGYILIHLGMSGSLRILQKLKMVEKHDHIDLVLSNGTILRYTDPRRFGFWLYYTELTQCTHLTKLGLEPLSDEFNVAYLKPLAVNRKSRVKDWLMNNQIVVGVGNIYASESLFNAQILPDRKIFSLLTDELIRLVTAIKFIIQQAINQGGTTLKDFSNAEGKPGYFSQKLQVYGREGQNCFICGNKICRKKIAQRSSFYCPVCQK